MRSLAQMERTVLGALLEGQSTLPPNCTALLKGAPEAFESPELGRLAVAIRRLRDTGTAVNPVTLAETVGNDQGLHVLLATLPGEALGLDVTEFEATRLVEAYRRRQARIFFLESAATLETNPQCLHAILDGTLDALNRMRTEAAGEDSLVAKLNARRFNFEARPEPPLPRFSIVDTPICTPGNLTTVSAAIKVGKSAWVDSMLASVLTSPNCTSDCFGLCSSNVNGGAVIHLDTEQSPFDHDALIRRVLHRAHADRPPEWFQSYCVTGWPASEARQAVAAALRQNSKRFGSVHSLVVDGVADLCADVNDPGEAIGLVNELHGLAIEYDCPIIGVIHVNPGTDKTRGHLGSQLERKAETNLRLEKAEEVTTVWSDKNRRAPIPKDHGPRFAWSDKARMHVTVTMLGESRDNAKRQRLEELAAAALNGSRCLAWGECIEAIGRVDKLTDRNARARFDAMRKLGVLVKNELGQWTIPSKSAVNAITP